MIFMELAIASYMQACAMQTNVAMSKHGLAVYSFLLLWMSIIQNTKLDRTSPVEQHTYVC